MGLIFMGLMAVLVLYILYNALCILYGFFCNHRSGRGNYQLKQTLGEFFVRSQNLFATSFEVSGPVSEQASDAPRYDIAMVLDCSGSMIGNPEKQAKSGAAIFMDNCRLAPDATQAAVVTFNESANIVKHLSSDLDQLKQAIEGIAGAAGGTSINEGLLAARHILLNSKRREDVQRVVILLSDGYDGNTDQVIRLAEKMKTEDKVSIYCLGIEGADMDLLGQICGNSREQGDEFLHSSSPEDLANLFEQISGSLLPASGKNAELTVNFNFDDLCIDRSMEYSIPYRRLRPATWEIPRLKEKSAEKIVAHLRSLPHVFGLTAVNSSADVLLSYVDTREQNEKKVSTSINSKRFVYVVPTFGWSWFWGLGVNKMLWNLWRWLCSPKAHKLPSASAEEKTQKPISVIKELPANTEAAVQDWHPVFIIGLGGGGIDAALRFRSYLSDASGGIHPENSNFRELYIDTDDHLDATPAFGAETLNMDNFLCIGDDLWELGRSLQNSRPPEFSWYDLELNRDLDRELFITNHGASRVRQLGRLSLHNMLLSNENKKNWLEKKLREEADWLAEKKAAQKFPMVFVFSTAIGGTGSAVLEDIVHLLLKTIENRDINLTDIIVDIFVPDIAVNRGEGSEKVLSGNRVAFLLELERVKNLSDNPSYPGAKVLRYKRFTDHDYLVKGRSGLSAIDAAAFLALLKASRDGDFNEKHGQWWNDVKQSAVLGGHFPSPIQSSVAGQCLPVTLIEEYADLLCATKIVEKRFGILGDMNGDNISVTPAPQPFLNDAVRQLFQGGCLEQGKAGEVLQYKIPLLFEYLFELSNMSGDDPALKTCCLDILTLLQGWMPGEVMDYELRLAALRLLESLNQLMNRPAVPSLSIAAALLKDAGERLRRAYQIFKNQDISGQYQAHELVLFTPEPLNAFKTLVWGYLDIISKIDQQISSWGFALGEGFPRQWRGGSINDESGRHFVGLGRRLIRGLEINRERMRDYSQSGGGHDFFNHIIDKPDILSQRISWHLDPDCFKDIEADDLGFTLGTNIFQLGIRPDGNGLEQHIFDRAGYRSLELESTLFKLIGNMRPWLASKDAAELMPERIDSENINQEAYFDHTVAGDNVFPKNTVKLDINFSAASDFRASNLFRSDAAFRRARRNHVQYADQYSALLQNAVLNANPHGNNSSCEPLKPAVVELLASPHRLQRFLYACLAKEVSPGFLAAEAGQALIFSQGDDLFYLARAENNEQLDWLGAARQFILEENCISTGRHIDLNSDWRPSAEQAEQLNDDNLPPQLREMFVMIVFLMKEHAGYLPSLATLSSSSWMRDKR